MKALKFYASWCGPCKGLTMTIAGAEGKFTAEIVNVDIDEDTDLTIKYKVRSVPTMILVDDTGSEIKRSTGMINEKQLLEFLKV